MFKSLFLGTVVGCSLLSFSALASFETGKNFFDKNYIEEAIVEWEVSAKDGDIDSQYALGKLYYDGLSVEQNFGKAKRWFEEAAAKDNIEAIYYLGRIHYFGLGTKKDYDLAISYWKKAAHQNHAPSLYRLGKMHYDGKGVKKNYKKAFSLYQQAAVLGGAEGQKGLGILFSKGRGTEKDLKEAVKWWKKAAEQNDYNAQYYLGRAYEDGAGVAQSSRKAADWYRKGADAGFARPSYRLGRLYEKGDGVPKSNYEAAYWYGVSAKRKNKNGLYSYARMLEAGKGVSRNVEAAINFYKAAAKKGNKKAKKALKRIEAGDIAEAEQKKDFSHLLEGPKQEFGNVRAIGSAYTDVKNRSFFDNTRIALNLLKELPEDLKQDTKYIDLIIYNPPSKYRIETSEYDETFLAEYVVLGDPKNPGAMVVYRNMRFSAPYALALAMMANGTYAKNHQRIVTLRDEIKLLADETDPKLVTKRKKYIQEFKELDKTRTASDSSYVKKQDCLILANSIKALKIWEVDVSKINGYANQQTIQGCHE